MFILPARRLARSLSENSTFSKVVVKESRKLGTFGAQVVNGIRFSCVIGAPVVKVLFGHQFSDRLLGGLSCQIFVLASEITRSSYLQMIRSYQKS
jgi:hypothetical protein